MTKNSPDLMKTRHPGIQKEKKHRQYVYKKKYPHIKGIKEKPTSHQNQRGDKGGDRISTKD